MRKTLSMLLAGVLMLGAGGFCTAADSPDAAKPVAVISLASYNEVLGDVNWIGKLAERPDVGTAIEGFLAMVTQGKGLAGFDKSRPFGFIVEANGPQIGGCAFIPVTSLKELLNVLELYTTVEQSNGLFKITPKGKGKTTYVKEAGAWALAAEKPEWVAQMAADPLALLGGFEKQYLLSARFFAANLPATLREKLVADIAKGIHRDFAPKAGEPEQLTAARKKLGDSLLETLTSLVQDLDQVTLGWTLDRKAENTMLDVSVTARSGTPLASQMAFQQIASSFSGFRLPGAAVSGNWAATLPAVKIEMLSALLDAVRAEAVRGIEKKNEPNAAVAKEIVNDLADLLQKTVKSGRSDGAATVMLGPQTATALAGVYVADGSILDKVIHRVFDEIGRANPAVASLAKLDADRLKDVRFHVVSIPIPPGSKDREKALQLIGENLEVAVGIGPTAVYASAGRDALATLKRAIEASAAPASAAILPLDLALDVEPIAAFAAVAGKPQDQPKAALVASELKKTPGQDHVRLVVRQIPQGIQYRLVVEPGIIRLIARLAALSQQHQHM